MSVAFGVVLLLQLSGTARDTTFRLPAGATVVANIGTHPIQVRVGGGDTLSLSGGRVALQQGSVMIQAPFATSSNINSPLVLVVPAWCTLTLRSTTGSMTLDASPQVLTAESNNGNIRLLWGIGSATLNTLAGNITVSNFQGNQLTVDAPGGDISVQNSSAAAQLSSINGAITLESMRGSPVNASTVNGVITLDGAYAAEGIYTLVSHNGGVTIKLKDSQAARVQGTTLRGSLINQMNAASPAARSVGAAGGRGGGSGRGSSLVTPLRSDLERGMQVVAIGTGGPTFYLTSFNGDIVIGRSN